ncbi:energy transducer TonB [Actomonas aquatica]|uniref:Energy transducer TonB n=1 Tax=Actomonas aquatica TaxID=2866162 RepID=A0ABZ1C7V9_9BACT|nr:energy transducer TonB [Opitutus sp. WL0086]WRQ87792.1 energy transducer TonB [Opitutus sp. WL0086]
MGKRCITLSALLFGLIVSGTLLTAANDLVERPRVLDFSRPSVPADIYRSGAEVDLYVEINESGRVIHAAVQRATDPGLAVPCLRAVRNWRFAPVLKNGFPARVRFIQPLRFGSRDMAAMTAASHPAQARRRVTPHLPSELADRAGEVLIAFSVTAAGDVADVTVVESTDPSLNDATIDAALRWRFRPALQEGYHVATRIFVPFEFKGTGSRPAPEHVAEHVDRPHASREAGAATTGRGDERTL